LKIDNKIFRINVLNVQSLGTFSYTLGVREFKNDTLYMVDQLCKFNVGFCLFYYFLCHFCRKANKVRENQQNVEQIFNFSLERKRKVLSLKQFQFYSYYML
jgi:hypothetical protein